MSSDGPFRNLIDQLIKLKRFLMLARLGSTEQFPSLMKLLFYFLYIVQSKHTTTSKSQHTSFFILKKEKKRLVANGTVRTS